jgi:transcriptional regulator with XRE-family HTH domain
MEGLHKTHPYNLPAMPRKAPKQDKNADLDASLGDRLARLRKERGFTQVELAAKMGIIQVLISDYECGKLRPNPDVLIKYATALQVTTDELLGLKPVAKSAGTIHNRRFVRRLQLIDQLPKRDQDALLRTIDAFLDRAKAG